MSTVYTSRGTSVSQPCWIGYTLKVEDFQFKIECLSILTRFGSQILKTSL